MFQLASKEKFANLSNRVAIMALSLISLALLLAGVSSLGSIKIGSAASIASQLGNSQADYAGCDPNWVIVESPSEGLSLNDIDAVSTTDIWSVGYYVTGTVYSTLIEHWDGAAWSIVLSPNQSGPENYLYGIHAITSSDIWAVGTHNVGATHKTLIEHWDGTSWSIVSSPNQGSGDNELYKVAAVSANDVWAVGFYTGGSSRRPLIEHWDGTSWSIVSGPDTGLGTAYLYSVAVVSANDVWAVGSVDNTSVNHTLIEHWDGTSWSIVPSPNQGPNNNALGSLAVASPNDIWAVGYYRDLKRYRTLIEHWDGTSWSIVPSANSPFGDNLLHDVAVSSTNDVWAVGYYFDDMYPRTLVQRWNGSTWNIVPSPNEPGNSNRLNAVVVAAPDDVWAVGDVGAPPTSTLIQRYNPCPVTVTPTQGVTQTSTAQPTQTNTSTLTPQPTQTPGGSTATLQPTNTTTATSTATNLASATASSTVSPSSSVTSTAVSTSTVIGTATGTGTGTGTATAATVTTTSTSTIRSTSTMIPSSTPTACTLQFTDVEEGSTFYDNIRCLACRGIINGYSTGCDTGSPCFKPGNLVTRGQLAKIVANAAGFTEPVGGQQFEDVPVGSTFFEFVWRLAGRGVINGYPCGGSGEPCAPGNLPYFRPNANITRGQISKIVSEAAGYENTPTGQQFEDVAEGSTFYLFIWRLADRQIMSGYQCGGLGEPCSNPALPYFRPGANATRGQASKIVSNTFYPGCKTPSLK